MLRRSVVSGAASISSPLAIEVAAPAYSATLVEEASLTGISLVAQVPSNQVWVVRFMAATFGSFLGFAAAGIGRSVVGPWSFLAASTGTKIIGIQHQTFTWEGRYVFEPDQYIWVNIEDGDTADVLLSGYKLSAFGF